TRLRSNDSSKLCAQRRTLRILLEGRLFPSLGVDEPDNGRSGRRRKRADRDRNGDLACVEREQLRDSYGNGYVLADRASVVARPAFHSRNRDVNANGFDAIPSISECRALKPERTFSRSPRRDLFPQKRPAQKARRFGGRGRGGLPRRDASTTGDGR